MNAFVLSLTVVGLAAALIVQPAFAQSAASYPTKPVRMIIPFPPGGSNDVVGRMFANQLSERLGQPIIIDNRGGAGGTIGTDQAAKSPPDGHTLLLASIVYAFSAAIYKKLPYDPVSAFTPVALLGTGPVILTVHPNVPAKTLQELIALAKQQPGRLQYASAGIGSFQHLSTELFKLQAGVDVLHVPYKGGGPAMADVIGGHAQILMGSLIQIAPQVRSGKLRGIALSGTARNSALPNVPTIAESGLPGYESMNWWGIFTPAGTPAAINERLHREVIVLLNSAETRKRLAAEGAEPVPMSSNDFARYVQTELDKWARVVKEARIQAE